MFTGRDRMVLLAAVLIVLLMLGGFGAFELPKVKEAWYSSRVQCANGCKGTACKKANCGMTCKKGPACKGCWKKSATTN